MYIVRLADDARVMAAPRASDHNGPFQRLARGQVMLGTEQLIVEILSALWKKPTGPRAPVAKEPDRRSPCDSAVSGEATAPPATGSDSQTRS